MLCFRVSCNQRLATSAELYGIAHFTPQVLIIIMCKYMYFYAATVELLISKHETCYGWEKEIISFFLYFT